MRSATFAEQSFMLTEWSFMLTEQSFMLSLLSIHFTKERFKLTGGHFDFTEWSFDGSVWVAATSLGARRKPHKHEASPADASWWAVAQALGLRVGLAWTVSGSASPPAAASCS